MEILIIVNIVATLLTAYWLTNENKAQATVITSLKTQLDTLNPFIDVLKKFTDASDIEKLLDVKTKLLEHDTEIKRREMISTISKQLESEWAIRFDKDIKQRYDTTYSELINFVVLYFSKDNFPNIIERNVQIKDFFPSLSEFIIKYLDKVSEQTINPNSDL